jgi:phosphatidylserine decarboxylase
MEIMNHAVALPNAAPRPSASAPITSVQPGGGFCMSIELAWSRMRRGMLRALFPSYVKRMQQLRQGECPNCAHDVIDARDLKYYRNVCSYWFRPEDDRYDWRNRIGLARHGLAEIIQFTLLAMLLGGLFSAAFSLELFPRWIYLILRVAIAFFLIEIIYFFRDPERTPPDDPNVLISPADGTVADITEVNDPDFAGGKVFRLGIFLSVFDVHVNRAPRPAKVVKLQYFPGRFHDARNPMASANNEQLWIDLEDTATGTPMRVKQISGAIARRIVCWLKVGDLLQAGERIGMIKFGSRTEVLLPAGEKMQLAVQVGSKVKGGETILLRLAEMRQ